VISAVILAAGRATRMGRTKQLLAVDDRPMLQHVIDAASAAGVDEIVVVLGHDAEPIQAALDLPPNTRVVVNPGFAGGQASSLRAGLAAVSPHGEAAVIVLGDQPGVEPDAIRAVVQAFRRTGARVVRTRYRDQPGHPVLLSRETWPELESLEGDVGAREIIERHPDWVVDVERPGPAPDDVDTPADYDRLVEGAVPGAQLGPDPGA
jgi:molybdenum cofactor cytidylyltransferase